ncbi:hypothetical protein M3Y97_00323500 [Aphelenchoides bicaudatus]|nr:hypothetical protein M3Y97_00323500 [Aphelenchoides bicaudatus]
MDLEDSTENELIFACTDPDPRVRAKGYSEIGTNVHERLSALRILEKLAQQYPEFLVKNQRGHELRIHDDAFTIMCHAINDLDTDKDKDGATVSTMTNTWSTGKKFGEAAPDIPDDDDESIAIIPTNSCGTFITALEDEFMAVRLPAVRSLCSLASTRPDFAFAAIDHVSDMFNDEMHEVRIASVQALTPLLTYVKLNESQLDSILSVLNDATPDTRFALHELLARANLADSSCIRQVLKQLMISMQRFPRDRDSIYRCLSEIGRQHSFLIHSLVPELFKIHPLFEPQEQDLNDDYYLAHLILAMNAAAVQPPIRPLMPKYAMKHYRFMRLAMPDVMPALECDIDGEFSKDSITNQVAKDQDIDKQLNFIYQQIFDAYSITTSNNRVPYLKMVLKDLTVSENAVEQSMVVPIRFLRTFCELLINYEACIQHYYSNDAATLNVIEESLQLITQIRYLFNNISSRVLQFLTECEFYLKLEYLFLKVEVGERITDAMLLAGIQQEIRRVQQQFLSLDLICSQPTKNLIMWVEEFVESHLDRATRLQTSSKDKKQIAGALTFLSSETHLALQKIGTYRLEAPSKLPQLRKCTIRSVKIKDLCDSVGQPINYTGTGSESIHRFIAGLPTALRLHANLINVRDDQLKNFRVEIVYPNDLHDYQEPQSSQLIPTGSQTFRLEMPIILTAEHWAEPSDVRIRCGFLINQDDGEEYEDRMDVDEQNDLQFKPPRTEFIPLLDADRLSHPNNIQLRVHPMSKC